MGLEIKGKAALGNKTLWPCSPNPREGYWPVLSQLHYVQATYMPQPPSLGKVRPLLCPIPPMHLYARLASLRHL